MFHLQSPNDSASLQDPTKKFKGDVMDLRLDIERRKRFAGKERDFKREGGKSPGGSRGPSRERSSEKSGKHHKKSNFSVSNSGKGSHSQLLHFVLFLKKGSLHKKCNHLLFLN